MKNQEQPSGNYYDKYGSKNPIVKELMKGFFVSIDHAIEQSIGSTKENIHVVEIGCGEGHVIGHIMETCPNIVPKGCDISEEAIMEARENYPEIPFSVENINHLPYETNSHDLVICCEVLEHIEDFESAIKELLRISRKYLLVSVPREPIWRALNLCRMKYISDLGNTPGHINHWGKNSFVQLLEKYATITLVQTPLPWTMVLLEKK